MDSSSGGPVDEYEAPAIIDRREIVGALQVGSGGDPGDTSS